MKVIVAIDGSDFSRSAVAKFCQLIVKPEDTEVKILSVVEKPAPMVAEPFAVSAEYYHAVEAEGLKQAGKFVSDAAEQIRNTFPNSGIKVTVQTLLGAPGREIVEIAQEWNADLIVVGSHGYNFWSRMMLGSVSDSVVHHAPCSVLVVRKAGNFNGNKN